MKQSSFQLLIAMFVQVFDCDTWHTLLIWHIHIPSSVHSLFLSLDFPLSVFLSLPFSIPPSHSNYSILFATQKVKHILHNSLIHPFLHDSIPNIHQRFWYLPKPFFHICILHQHYEPVF